MNFTNRLRSFSPLVSPNISPNISPIITPLSIFALAFAFLVVVLPNVSNVSNLSAQTVVATEYGPFAGSQFGTAIDISPSGEYVITGAPMDDFFGLDRGLVVVGRITENGLEQVGQPLAGAGNSDQFGYSVAITDDATIFIGSRFDDTAFSSGGSVSVYTYNEDTNTFVLSQKIDAQQDNEQFGWALDTSDGGEALAVSAVTYDYNVPGNGVTGIVRLYRRASGANTYTECEEAIEYEATATNVEFGSAVAVDRIGDGIKVAVSAPKEKVGELNGAGIVEYYSNNLTCAGPWSKVGATLTGTQEFQDFGSSLSLRGGMLAVGSKQYNATEVDAGSVQVFQLDGGWQQVGSTLTGTQLQEYFGVDVALADNGNTLVVGASQYNAEPPFVTHGKVERYRFDGEAMDWVKTGTEVSGYRGSFLGTSVAANSAGDDIVAGAPFDSETNNDNGKIYYITYETAPDTLSQTYSEGWNMVSLPVQFAHNDYAEVFPFSVPATLYSFDGIYSLEDVLTPGIGYWVTMSQDGGVVFSGDPVGSFQVNLMDGWNIIASMGEASVVEDPNGLVNEQELYSFDGAYQVVGVMEPGRAYWVFSEGAGVISVVPAPAP